MNIIVAIRTRSDGEWHATAHYSNMEIRGGLTSSITSVAKDNLLLEIYEGENKMTIDNETRRYILDRLMAIRESASGKNPGRKERAVLRAVREIEEVVK